MPNAIYEDLKLTLENHAGLAALIGNRIYPLKKPQNATYPCVTYQLISGGEDYTHQGKTTLEDPEWQISAWGKTYKGAKQVATQIKLAVKGFPSEVSNEIDLYEDEVEIYHIPITVQIFHQT